MNKSTLIVSLDFELMWGMHDLTNYDEFFERYHKNIEGVWTAIPELLKLFEKHDIHATWATVGYLFGNNYDEVAPFVPVKSLWPTYTNKLMIANAKLENIDHNSKYHYAGELVDLIGKTKGQEIGSHTFSHYYCKEKGQTVEQFESDIIAAKNIANSKGYELKSAILPRNECARDHIDVLTKHGFVAFRDEENDWIHNIKIRPLMRALRLMDVYFPLTGQGGYTPKKENGIWNLMGSRMYKPYFAKLSFLENRKIKRIKKQMLHAAKKGLTFHFWWHPHNIGVMTDFHLRQLEEVFSYYDELKEKYGMQSLNMGEVVEMLENK